MLTRRIQLRNRPAPPPVKHVGRSPETRPSRGTQTRKLDYTGKRLDLGSQDAIVFLRRGRCRNEPHGLHAFLDVGQCVTLMPAASLNLSPSMWLPPPAPEELNRIWPGLGWASAMRSLTVFTPSEGATTKAEVEKPIWVALSGVP